MASRTGCLIIGVGPVDHTVGPVHSALRFRWDASGPEAIRSDVSFD